MYGSRRDVKVVSGAGEIRLAPARLVGPSQTKAGQTRSYEDPLRLPRLPQHPVVSRIMTDVLVNRFARAAPGLNVPRKKESSARYDHLPGSHCRNRVRNCEKWLWRGSCGDITATRKRMAICSCDYLRSRIY